MLSEEGARDIASDFLKREKCDHDGFVEARFISEDHVWAIVFLRKSPKGAVDCPATIIIDVDPKTGTASFFDNL